MYYKVISDVQINEKRVKILTMAASFEMLIEQAGVIIMTTVYAQETIFQAIKSALLLIQLKITQVDG